MEISTVLKNNKLLILIIIVAAIFRFYHIDYQSIWLDEIYTINEANPKNTFSQIHSQLLNAEPHPPLYFLIIHFAFKLFGYSIFVLRFFTAIIGILGVFSIYLLGNEIFNKKVGLYATILLSINYFHIYYSQEGRMYVLLFLTTTMSFYFLIKFIKNSNIKNALIYSVFSTLMIYSHFFALFALVSQYLILLYFVIKPYNTTGKKFFTYCAISGISTLLLYLPTYSLFKKTTEMKSIWIKMPTLDVYTQIIKDFFGQSEIVIFLILILFILFFIQLFSEKNNNNFKINPTEDKLVFGFFILFIWISITLILPLIRTYMSLPMLINRYFINILPAFIIIIAIGLYYIKNEIVRYLILSLIVVFSVTDIVVVKKYYKTVNKTQFREATNFIIENNSSKDNVVSSLGWCLPYFLNNEKNKNTIIEKSLDLYVSEISQNKLNLKAFWYFDGHIRPYDPSDVTKSFLEQNYIADKSIELYDCYAKHFILKADYKPNIDINNFIPLKELNGDKINFAIETFDSSSDKISLNGWAYFDGQGMENAVINIIAIKENKPKAFSVETVLRDDVTTYFKSSFNLSKSGFKASLLKSDFEKGNYQIGIIVKDSKSNKNGLVISDKNFIIE